ncbi:MAG: hypothetical protein AAB267_07970 [Candidatus Desantisbacteria bacterium]
MKEVMIAIELWVETAEKEGREIPSPLGKELLQPIFEKEITFRSTSSQLVGV